ncbi:MAG TPA: hypothetical protein VMV10_10840, partial [Pirellulales bacterium]|nr:hypothetical protein [Pirellulales bacterium]
MIESSSIGAGEDRLHRIYLPGHAFSRLVKRRLESGLRASISVPRSGVFFDVEKNVQRKRRGFGRRVVF